MKTALAKAYAVVRDATLLNSKISTAEAIAVLEVIKAELVAAAQRQIDTAVSG